MLARVIASAGFTALFVAGAAFAQSDAPAELPDATYQGQSYVDSQGCVFLRAGYGGTAEWVPRVGQDRKPVCGQTPTNAIAKVTDAAASKTPTAAKPRVKKHRAPQVAPKDPVLIRCPASVPVPRRYATTDGGSVVICTATNGSLTGARSPIYPAGSGVGAALSQHRYAGVTIPLPNAQSATAPAASANDAYVVPKGYARAGDDGRFNPLRGKSSTAGLVAQTAAPSPEPVSAVKPTPAKAAIASGPAGAFYVQVGTFGQPANADATSARLTALGLPVAKGAFSKQGQLLQIIYAGPFASVSDAQAALAAARGLGFADAFLR